jgi:hypothetical protein
MHSLSLATGQITCVRQSCAALDGSSLLEVFRVAYSQQECFHVGTEYRITPSDFLSAPQYFMVHWKGNDYCYTVFLSVRDLDGLRNLF